MAWGLRSTFTATDLAPASILLLQRARTADQEEIKEQCCTPVTVPGLSRRMLLDITDITYITLTLKCVRLQWSSVRSAVGLAHECVNLKYALFNVMLAQLIMKILTRDNADFRDLILW